METNETANRKPRAAGVTNGAGKLAGATGEEEIGAAEHAQGVPAASRASVGRRGANGVRSATGDCLVVAADGGLDGVAQRVRHGAALFGDADRLRRELVAHGPRKVGGGPERLDSLIDNVHGVNDHTMFRSLSTIILDAESTVADPDRLDAIEAAIMGIVSAMAVARPAAAEAMVRGWERDKRTPERLKSTGLLPLLAGHVRRTIAAAHKGSPSKGSRG